MLQQTVENTRLRRQHAENTLQKHAGVMKRKCTESLMHDIAKIHIFSESFDREGNLSRRDQHQSRAERKPPAPPTPVEPAAPIPQPVEVQTHPLENCQPPMTQCRDDDIHSIPNDSNAMTNLTIATVQSVCQRFGRIRDSRL